MNIRFAKEDDVNAIVKLCELHAAYEKTNFDATDKASKLSLHIFSKKTLECLVVENNNKIIGYATFMKQFSTWDANFYMYLDCLFFMEAFRGKGLGTQLMQKIKEYAKKENYHHIQWQTPSFNIKAIDFYTKIGATSKNKERFFWRV